jgi:phosphatidylserine/phosphatidylglycerophosphate/cardiolipin synthase-like enzyme
LNPNNDTDQLPGLASTFRRIHIHSKLAIIDDRYALVGSANFNRRSLEQDGECSVGVFDPTVVKKFRQDLFSHWGVSGENWDWTNIMTGFAQNPSEGVGPVPLRIDALSTQMPGWWWNYLTALSDGSDFM